MTSINTTIVCSRCSRTGERVFFKNREVDLPEGWTSVMVTGTLPQKIFALCELCTPVILHFLDPSSQPPV